jgi:hypothetical protein
MEVTAAAVLLAVSVNTLEVVALAGLKVAVTPAGRPDAVNATGPVNPACGVMVMVLVLFDPWGMVRLLGDAESPKSGVAAALTLSVIVVV